MIPIVIIFPIIIILPLPPPPPHTPHLIGIMQVGHIYNHMIVAVSEAWPSSLSCFWMNGFALSTSVFVCLLPIVSNRESSPRGNNTSQTADNWNRYAYGQSRTSPFTFHKNGIFCYAKFYWPPLLSLEYEHFRRRLKVARNQKTTT